MALAAALAVSTFVRFHSAFLCKSEDFNPVAQKTNKQKTIVVSSLKVGVNGLVTIYFAYQVLCDEAFWHTNAASNNSNLKIISLFPVLTHRRQFLQQSEKGHADSSVFFTT